MHEDLAEVSVSVRSKLLDIEERQRAANFIGRNETATDKCRNCRKMRRQNEDLRQQQEKTLLHALTLTMLSAAVNDS